MWKFAHLHDKNLSNDRLMCADLCQTGFCLSIIENRNFPESSILYLASKGVFSFICLSAGSRKDRFNSAKFGTVAKLAMRQPFVLFKGLTFQKLCLPGAFRP
ncbi:hypothetical protein, partial [Klebsiella pneumoniae]|uniref:hypothetical protein n=1 Tax=Klebsiella pneumoniae TaxID=573 RepID=UPI001C70886C